MIFKTNDHSSGMRVEVAKNNIDQENGGHFTHTINTLDNGVNYSFISCS